jgi:SAM-dependent methyltransferase
MAEQFANVYDDDARALAYSHLEFPGTYFLAFRDLPGLLRQHVTGPAALDFGCGAGRSSRFLKTLGFDVTGVDISASMLAHARERDPDGRYLLVSEGDLNTLAPGRFDLVFSAFTFDNVRGGNTRARLFRQFRELLSPGGTIVNLMSAPEIYLNEWASFTTREFTENRAARTGDTVRIVMLDVHDRRPVEDVLWLESDYRDTYAQVGLEVIDIHRPLGTSADLHQWISETHTSPWAIHLLRKPAETAGLRGQADTDP